MGMGRAPCVCVPAEPDVNLLCDKRPGKRHLKPHVNLILVYGGRMGRAGHGRVTGATFAVVAGTYGSGEADVQDEVTEVQVQ